VPHSPIATALVAAAALLLPCSLLAQQRRQSRLRKGTSLQRPPVVLTAVAQKRMTIYDLDAMDEDLPDGWDAIVDTESGFVYFAHETSNEVTWDWPTSNGKVKRPPPPPPPPPPEGEAEVVQKQSRQKASAKKTAAAPAEVDNEVAQKQSKQKASAKKAAAPAEGENEVAQKPVRTKASTKKAAPPAEGEAEVVQKASVTPEGEELMLVDAHACLYASYHATVKYELRNERGEPTGAILGFANTIRAFLRELPATHFAVMFDSQGSANKRKELLPQYKEHRGEMPDELKQQIVKAKEMCDAFGWRYQEEAGYEADDLIHTFAESASKKMRVHIVSPDKDLAQLVGPNVVLHRETKKPTSEMTAEQVEKKWGVRPDQLGDYLAMSGDVSDGIPGVPGIGPTIARKLLQQHETLELVIEAAENDAPLPFRVPKKINVALVENKEHVRLMRKVVALQTVPGVAKGKFLEELRIPEFDNDRLKRALEFCEKEDMSQVAARLEIEYAEKAR